MYMYMTEEKKPIHVYDIEQSLLGKCFGFRRSLIRPYYTYFLGHLSHSGDLLLWVGVRRRASCVVRRALTSSSQELLGQS